MQYDSFDDVVVCCLNSLGIRIFVTCIYVQPASLLLKRDEFGWCNESDQASYMDLILNTCAEIYKRADLCPLSALPKVPQVPSTESRSGFVTCSYFPFAYHGVKTDRDSRNILNFVLIIIRDQPF